jgi:hypothetical protein
MAGKKAKPATGEVKFIATLQAAASGVFSSELGSVKFIDIEKLTKGERKCGEVLSWLCQKPPSGDGSTMLPSSALPLLP